jgi:negative regulator of sigma E activity
VAAIEPVVRNRKRSNDLLRQATRLVAVACYAAAVLAAVLLVRPAFHHVQTPTAEVPATPVVQQMDALRKGETVATFAARHGLELGDLLALNPSIDSLTIPAGTKLRIG